MPTIRLNHAKIRELRAAGVPTKDIAKQFGASEVYLRRLLNSTLIKKDCILCGKKFTAARTNAVYCSDACKVRACRLRQKASVNY